MRGIKQSSTSPELELSRKQHCATHILTSKALLECLAESHAVENHRKRSCARIGLSEGRRAANSCIHFPSGSLIKWFRLLCNEHRCSCAKQTSASSWGLFITLTLTLASVRLNHCISMSKRLHWPLYVDWGNETQSRWWCETIYKQQILKRMTGHKLYKLFIRTQP